MLARLAAIVAFAIVCSACEGAHSSSKLAPAVVPVRRVTTAPVQATTPTIEVRFEGNEALSRAELLSEIRVHEESPPPRGDDLEAVLQRDELLVAAAYYDRGYLQVNVRPPRVYESAGDARVTVVFSIREGPRYRLRRLVIDERDDAGRVVPLGNADLRKMIALGDGAWFSRAVLVQGLADVLRLYRDAGYAEVDAPPRLKLDETARTVDVEVAVVRGKQMRIESILVSGNRAVPTHRIMKEVLVTTGALFSQTGLERTKQRLVASGLFGRVDIATAAGTRDDLLSVHIEVEERAPASGKTY